MTRLVIALLALVLAQEAAAQAPESSLRPMARPGSDLNQAIAVAMVTAPVASAPRHLRPRAAPRPVRRAATDGGQMETVEIARPADRQKHDGTKHRAQGDRHARASALQGHAEVGRAGLFRSLRPLLRPRGITRKAVARRKALAKGAVCGDPDIQGQAVGQVPGRISGCGVENAVRVRAIRGIRLTQEAVMDCVTAKTLKNWIAGGLKPAVGATGGGVTQIRVLAHYACRTRNNKKGAKISEHGKGRAIDIAGFTLRDGSKISVLRDWNRGARGRILRQAHASACGPFGTVLGPGSDYYHRDHFHFDTARHRGGAYCR